mgnify:CR=1 FL=1
MCHVTSAVWRLVLVVAARVVHDVYVNLRRGAQFRVACAQLALCTVSEAGCPRVTLASLSSHGTPPFGEVSCAVFSVLYKKVCTRVNTPAATVCDVTDVRCLSRRGSARRCVSVLYLANEREGEIRRGSLLSKFELRMNRTGARLYI